VLSGRARQRRISGATVAKVRAAAERVGYHGNAAARALARGTSGAIAFAVSDTSLAVLTSAFTGMTAAGVVHRAHALGWTAGMIGAVPGDSDYLAAALASVAERRYDGVIAHGPLLRERDLAALARHRETPVVAIDPPPGLERPAVRIDLAPGIAEAIADLAAHGHHHVCFVGTDALRAEQIRAACAARALAFHACAPSELLGHDDHPTPRLTALLAEGRCAIVAYNDQLAARLCRAIVSAGGSIPRHAALIGFDAVESRWTTPRLGSIDHRFADLGAAAVDLLLERLRSGPDFRVQRSLPARYVRGDSVG
jgi:LacI family transcriptional regulator